MKRSPYSPNIMPPSIQGKGKHGSTGFSLVELMIVIAIMGIFTAIAVPSFSAFIASQRINNVAIDLFTALLKARSEAVKRNTNVTLSPKSSNWENGWELADPSNGSNKLEDREAVSNLTITGPTSVVYQSSGRIQGTTAPCFNISSSTSGSTAKYVSADLTGRPYTKVGSC